MLEVTNETIFIAHQALPEHEVNPRVICLLSHHVVQEFSLPVIVTEFGRRPVDLWQTRLMDASESMQSPAQIYPAQKYHLRDIDFIAHRQVQAYMA
jgi:hypothetical protein